MSAHSTHTVSGMTPHRIKRLNTTQPRHKANADSSVAATSNKLTSAYAAT